MGFISNSKRNVDFQTAEQALDIIREALTNEKEIWINLDKENPCMAICINGEYAAINYFNDEEMFLSYNKDNMVQVTFLAGGEEWMPDPDVVISINDMFSCVKEFIETRQRPTCIQWQDL